MTKSEKLIKQIKDSGILECIADCTKIHEDSYDKTEAKRLKQNHIKNGVWPFYEGCYKLTLSESREQSCKKHGFTVDIMTAMRGLTDYIEVQ